MLTTGNNVFFRINLSMILGAALYVSGACVSYAEAEPVDGKVNRSSSLQGTWSHCNQFKATSTEFRWTFTGSTFINIKGDYMNNNCSGSPAHGYSELYSGSFVIGTQAGSSSGMDTTLLNLTVEKAFGMPMPQYGIYTIYAIGKNVLYLGDTRTGPDGFSPLARPTSLQIEDGDYIRLN
jgi:hypothetical protein